jgi:hypothetical protein
MMPSDLEEFHEHFKWIQTVSQFMVFFDVAAVASTSGLQNQLARTAIPLSQPVCARNYWI